MIPFISDHNSFTKSWLRTQKSFFFFSRAFGIRNSIAPGPWEYALHGQKSKIVDSSPRNNRRKDWFFILYLGYDLSLKTIPQKIQIEEEFPNEIARRSGDGRGSIINQSCQQRVEGPVIVHLSLTYPRIYLSPWWLYGCARMNGVGQYGLARLGINI